jgi:hypothetical protein
MTAIHTSSHGFRLLATFSGVLAPFASPQLSEQLALELGWLRNLAIHLQWE